MRVDDFDYELPRELIAQAPADKRDAARLLYFDESAPRGAELATRHGVISDLIELLEPGDLLVLNNTRVRAARLFAYRATGARVEFLFLRPEQGQPKRWTALVNPARKIKVDEVLTFELPGGTDHGRVPTLRAIERLPHDAEPDKPGPTWLVDFEGEFSPEQLEEFFELAGHMPLPPYISRKQGTADDSTEAFDRERYQTVFNETPGAVAAPTAGLHFTPELLDSLARKGIGNTTVTLHVGLGTFATVEAADTADHKMHSERYELLPSAVQEIEKARANGGRIVCVGTTAVRVLESCAAQDGVLRAGVGETRLFLTPGSKFHVCDMLLTNFHLPKSTLLMLVSAFIGRDQALGLYAEAIGQRYRFFSYGDAMLLARGSH